MGTSGTYTFSLQIDDVINEAMEMVGGEPVLGYEPSSARRSLNLLLSEWQNRGVLLWMTEEARTTVTSSIATVTLPPSTEDVLEMTYTISDTDYVLDRVGIEEYMTYPNKLQVASRPSQYATWRSRDNVIVYLYPCPDNSSDSLHYWRIRKHEDVTKSYQDPDVPARFLPALTTGLAYYMSMKRPGISVDRIGMLKARHEESLNYAMGEDRERASFFIKINTRVR